MMTPNLFSFATSELSQDAFLCWMAALSTSDDPDLARAGKSFLAWLWKTAGMGNVTPEQINLVCDPERQIERIDVLLHAEVAGTSVKFVIEDKTGTSHRSGQLERYRKGAEKRWPIVVPIYFKTGYHFSDDLSAKNAGYAVVDLDAWMEFLDGIEVRNDILEDYRSYVSSLLRARKENLDALWETKGFERLGIDYVQFDFLKRLRQRCPDRDASRNSNLSRGTNRGGTPWAHLGFWWITNSLPGGVSESFFHRVDKRGDGGVNRFYLSTRQYAQVKGIPNSKKEKVSRLWQYRKLFEDSVIAASSGLVFSKPAGDHRGANESEIGVLFFNESTNTTRAVLEQFPAVHKAFVSELARDASEDVAE